MAGRGRDVDGPVTGGAHVALAPSCDRLIGPDAIAEMLLPGVLRADGRTKFVVETLLGEIALFFGNPFLQPEVRRDDELGHGRLLVRERISEFYPTAGTSRACSARTPPPTGSRARASPAPSDDASACRGRGDCCGSRTTTDRRLAARAPAPSSRRARRGSP